MSPLSAFCNPHKFTLLVSFFFAVTGFMTCISLCRPVGQAQLYHKLFMIACSLVLKGTNRASYRRTKAQRPFTVRSYPLGFMKNIFFSQITKYACSLGRFYKNSCSFLYLSLFQVTGMHMYL